MGKGASMSTGGFRRLYKYRSMGSQKQAEHARRVIVEGELYYASPSQFNDPFDSRLAITDRIRPLTKEGRRKLNDFKEKQQADLENELGIFCLSEVNDDILMWSHYADFHRGICLEFQVHDHNELHRVEYSNERVVLELEDLLDPDSEVVLNQLSRLCLVKATQWSYEREWRCIVTEGSGVYPLPSKMLTGIIFGCKASVSVKKDVVEWVRASGRRVSFYQATESDEEFKLTIVPL